jgi:hypothetical protein
VLGYMLCHSACARARVGCGIGSAASTSCMRNLGSDASRPVYMFTKINVQASFEITVEITLKILRNSFHAFGECLHMCILIMLGNGVHVHTKSGSIQGNRTLNLKGDFI